MAFEGRCACAVAVVPQNALAAVALHEAHWLIRVRSHKQRELRPHAANATEPRLVVPGRD